MPTKETRPGRLKFEIKSETHMYELRKNQTHVGIPVEHMQNKIRHVSSTLSSPAEAEHSAAWLELIKLNAWVVRIDFPQKRVENETFCSCRAVRSDNPSK